MSAIPLQSGIIYGPVKSRRLGWSLGLNISPTSYKFCSFDCVYCQYGWTANRTMDVSNSLEDLPTADSFRIALEKALKEHQGKRVDNITFSGNGEPTLHPQFAEMVNIAKRLRDKYLPVAKLGVLSNSSTIGMEEVHRALASLDFKIMKLDAGDPETFQKINRYCTGVDFETIVTGLKFLGNVTLQTMFIDGTISNTGDREVKSWIGKVGIVRPLKTQIYSLHRPPAALSVREVPEEKLREIAAKTEATTGVPVEVITAASSYSKRINQPYDS
jgi:wyosine [tRNA(Phe)-imidazoG37] synthetase (radical SAM superfamily)